MANYQSTHTGAQIDAGIDLLDKNSATSGQVLTANGTGGASWQNASGGGGGGGAVGGGFTVTSHAFMGSGKILILGSYAGRFGWHEITIDQMSTPSITNAVMMCVLSVADGATSIQTTHLLYDFSGKQNEYSNLALNKMYYIRQDVEIQITD